jgi:hypothetical protein
MLNQKNIHNSAMLKPQVAKKPLKKDTKDKLKEKGKTDGLRQGQLHDSSSHSNVS